MNLLDLNLNLSIDWSQITIIEDLFLKFVIDWSLSTIIKIYF